MTDDLPNKVDCYADSERDGMVRYQNFKDRRLAPLLDVLTRCGITPNRMTLISTLIGLAFVPAYFWSPGLAFGLLIAHLILDGVDGPLARHTGTASQAGSFVDTVGDQVVVVATTIALMASDDESRVIGIVSGSIYCLTYTIVVGFAMIRNALRVPYRFILRPRWIVSVWMIVDHYFLRETLDYLIWGCNALLIVLTITGFEAIRSALTDRVKQAESA